MNEGALDTYPLLKTIWKTSIWLELQLPAPSDRIVGITANGKNSMENKTEINRPAGYHHPATHQKRDIR